MTSQALVKTLGIKSPKSPLDLIETIRQGLPKQALERLARALRVKVLDLEHILPVSRRTLQRYEQQNVKCLPKELSDHMLQVAKVYARAVEVFEDEVRALEWLQAPIVALGGRIPMSLLDTSTGVDLVLTELGRIEYGVFA
jgi:putative toxin-antitoxin system antitoxin component (TIGR02293 family)